RLSGLSLAAVACRSATLMKIRLTSMIYDATFSAVLKESRGTLQTTVKEHPILALFFLWISPVFVNIS
ncbi:MAG: hypothetical protein ABF377_01775, partial [Akkermansiaceae bacterium]